MKFLIIPMPNEDIYVTNETLVTLAYWANQKALSRPEAERSVIIQSRKILDETWEYVTGTKQSSGCQEAISSAFLDHISLTYGIGYKMIFGKLAMDFFDDIRNNFIEREGYWTAKHLEEAALKPFTSGEKLALLLSFLEFDESR